jgi:polysaccharide biosynthesis protein PelE
MYQPKLGLYALTLEATAWAGVTLGDGSDGMLLLYLAAHAGASMILSLFAAALLPQRLCRPRLPALLLFFGTSFAIPVLGIVAVALGVALLNVIPPPSRDSAFKAIVIPEVDMHQRAGTGFRQAGMRAFISNARAPVATRMRALVALQNISGRIASPLLRDVLADPSEDIRLLAYGMLDNKEKVLNDAIHEASKQFSAAPADSDQRLTAARKLADLYWELVYQELALGDLRTHALHQSRHFLEIALAGEGNDAALHLRLGRLLQLMGQPADAGAAYDRALALGMPKTRIVPYLAEVAYDLGRYNEVRALMQDLGEWQSLPRLKPVIRYWSQA